jgi:hypothetical protein
MVRVRAWQIIADVESASILEKKVAARRPPVTQGWDLFWLIVAR